MRNLFYIGLLSLLINSYSLADESATIIRSSVSPEFPDGLHYKYLKYVANKMDMALNIYPMPFARRLRSLETGEIDIMVGVRRVQSKEYDFVFLEPHYEVQSVSLFVRQAEVERFQSDDDLRGSTIGVTNNGTLINEWGFYNGIKIVEVSRLSQKIGMLLKGRLDGFSHFEKSTLDMLADLESFELVKKARYQPPISFEYYFAISSQSELIGQVDALEQVIKTGFDSGHFAKIRAAHYEK